MLGKEIITAGKTIRVFDDDLFIVSYPRSGNTWLRFLLSTCIHNINNVDFNNLEHYAPDIYQNSNSYLLSLERPRLIKSHEKHNPGYGNVVYCYRDVRNVLVSFYYYLKKQGANVSFDCFFDGFIAGNIFRHLSFGDWGENVSGWLEHLDSGSVVKYEDLLSDTKGAMIALLKALNRDPDEQLVDKAVRKYEMNNMRKLELSSRDVSYLEKNREIPFVGGGKADDWKEICSSRQIDILTRKYGNLLEQLGYEVSGLS